MVEVGAENQFWRCQEMSRRSNRTKNEQNVEKRAGKVFVLVFLWSLE